ncbi:Iron only hydrogenase large subunit C-terminal domain [Carpediemonas membranifera]|uniref:Iron only hydrogenase large subunit C-terminal domain n=1 Tax=Carpediemonas membranifera TaxID=201153 RepID=A0A8J6E232_9EUKA|nr:Iron only hydrogenase large subunit C-terminal domain [Carpediemonas membranifera]|eukprot:KAG9397119.1 Iron only hydrogenase large subunit C-terminal domain [Carpediemonas membranifera]
MSIKLGELNDYLELAEECTIPLQEPEAPKGEVQLRTREEVAALKKQAKEERAKPERAEISLQDCLACSGCITSAEAVFVQSQGGARFMQVLTDNVEAGFRPVVSIAPQSLVSLAVHYNLPHAEVFSKLSAFFKTNGAELVSTNEGQAEALRDFIREFEQLAPEQLPLVVSSCPGFVCVCEKQNPEVLPKMSRVGSPMAYTAAWVHSTRPEGTKHLSIQPCFDRKLESARPEFQPGAATEVVISPFELVDVISDKLGVDSLESVESDSVAVDPVPEGVSGNYGEHLCAHYGVSNSEWRPKRRGNPDFTVSEAELPMKGGPTRVMLYKAYGARNIYNVTRMVRTRGERAVIEAMACPGGCVMGGGQCPAPDSVGHKTFAGMVHDAWDKLEVAGLDGVRHSEVVRQTFIDHVETAKDATTATMAQLQW